MDYVDKLTDKEKQWLNTFTEEYTNANFNHGKKVLHKTKTQKKDCYDRNNARNRDILTREKAAGTALYLEDIKEKDNSIKDLLGEALENEFDNLDNTNGDSNKNSKT